MNRQAAMLSTGMYIFFFFFFSLSVSGIDNFITQIQKTKEKFHHLWTFLDEYFPFILNPKKVAAMEALKSCRHSSLKVISGSGVIWVYLYTSSTTWLCYCVAVVQLTARGHFRWNQNALHPWRVRGWSSSRRRVHQHALFTSVNTFITFIAA